MKTINEILNTFKTDLSADIPDLLYDEDLEDFDTYAIGPSRNPEEKALFVYKSDLSKDDLSNSITIIFALQLENVNCELSTEYEDVLLDYLENYPPSDIGMITKESLTSETVPLDEGGSTFIAITVMYTEKKDSCDSGD